MDIGLDGSRMTKRINLSRESLITSHTINIELALIGIRAAIEKSKSVGVQTCISIVDSHGHSIASARMDGAPVQSILLAEAKAKSVAGNGVATHEFWELLKNEPSITSASSQIQGAVWISGGVPVMYGEDLIAALGISGRSSMSIDLEIALVAQSAIIQEISGK